MQRDFSTLLGLAVVALLGPACGGDSGDATGPITGSVEISVTTSGGSPDPDGYLVSVDQAGGVPLPVNGSITIQSLGAGQHQATLTGLAANCAVAGTNPRSFSITEGNAAEVVFEIACQAAGALQVSATTTGANLDIDGYQITIDGGTPQPLLSNGSLTLEGLSVGAHLVALEGIAENCVVAGDNPRAATITEGATTEVAFEVACSAPTPANPEIAFANNGMWVMDRDGANATLVTPGGAFNPSWSPYGDGEATPYQIAYDAGEAAPVQVVDVTLVNGVPTGDTPRILVADGRLPAWSPGSDEIAYIRGDTAIWVIGADGTNPHEVARRDTAATFTRVTWRFDGRMLAWIEDAEDYSSDPVRTIKSATRASLGSTNWSPPTALYVVGRTPGGLSSLAWGNTGDSLLFVFGDIDRVALLDLTGNQPKLDTLFVGTRPVWSPDDREVLFVDPGKSQRPLALYSFANGSTTFVHSQTDGGRPDWRR